MQRHIPAVFAEQWMVPLQFFDRVVDIAVTLQRQVVAHPVCATTDAVVDGAFLDVVDVPVIIQRRFCRAVLGPGG